MPTMTPDTIDFVETAPVRIDTELTLRQPPEQVWEALVDNESWSVWFRSCKAARTTSESPTGVGSTRWMHVDLFKVNERIIVWDEPERWGFTLLDANIPLADTVVELVTLEPDGDGTKLVYRFAAQLKGWTKPLEKLLRWRFTNMFRNSLEGLQPYLDQRFS